MSSDIAFLAAVIGHGDAIGRVRELERENATLIARVDRLESPLALFAECAPDENTRAIARAALAGEE